MPETSSSQLRTRLWDAADRLYVVESRRGRVQVYAKDTDYVDVPADA